MPNSLDNTGCVIHCTSLDSLRITSPSGLAVQIPASLVLTADVVFCHLREKTLGLLITKTLDNNWRAETCERVAHEGSGSTPWAALASLGQRLAEEEKR